MRKLIDVIEVIMNSTKQMSWKVKVEQAEKLKELRELYIQYLEKYEVKHKGYSTRSVEQRRKDL